MLTAVVLQERACVAMERFRGCHDDTTDLVCGSGDGVLLPGDDRPGQISGGTPLVCDQGGRAHEASLRDFRFCSGGGSRLHFGSLSWLGAAATSSKYRPRVIIAITSRRGKGRALICSLTPTDVALFFLCSSGDCRSKKRLARLGRRRPALAQAPHRADGSGACEFLRVRERIKYRHGQFLNYPLLL